MRALAALNMRGNLLLFFDQWIVKDSTFYRRAEHCLVGCVNSRYATKIYTAIVLSDLVNETARPYPKYYNLCDHNTMW